MFDILLTLYQFISGLGYFVYSVLSAFNNAVSFFSKGLPYTLSFLATFRDAPIFTCAASLLLGTRLIRFVRGVS